MMIKNIRHTGIVVNNLELMTNFYIALGFSKFMSGKEQGEFIDSVTGLKNVNLEWVKLKSKDGNLIELLKYYSHPDKKFIDNNRNSNSHGCSHLAFTVDSAESICECIKNNGGNIINPPHLSPDNKVKVAYCHDPEGIIMEIVEECHE